MCLAIPGRIISISNGKAIVQYPSEKKEAIAKGIDVRTGDYVLVQFGMIVEKLDSAQAREAIADFSALDSQPE